MKKINLTGTLISSALFMVLVGCSSTPNEAEIIAPAPKKSNTETVGIEATQVAAEQNAEFFTEINFSKKQKNLSKANQGKIRRLLSDATKKGEVDEIKVISWADKEYPSAETKKLSEDERQIADDRNGAIKSFIANLNKDIKVKAYSMAERASALKEFVGSSEARVKKSLEVAGIPTTEGAVKYPSKASKSIVMIILK